MAESAFLQLMPDTVTIKRRTGHNNYGEPTFATTASTYRCRHASKKGFMRIATGETVAIRSVLWLYSTGTILIDDRVTLSDGTSPEVVAVDRFPDQTGTHHYRISLGH